MKIERNSRVLTMFVSPLFAMQYLKSSGWRKNAVTSAVSEVSVEKSYTMDLGKKKYIIK